MERLTIRNSEGVAVLKTPYQCEQCGEVIYRLSDYGSGEPIEKLARLEDLKEQGKLLKLPCAVGDTVYVLEKSQTGRVMIYQTTADSFYCAIWALDGKFGKYIFPTYAEAEAALKELERVRTAQALM